MKALIALILLVAGAPLVTVAWFVPGSAGDLMALAGICCAGAATVLILGVRRGGAR